MSWKALLFDIGGMLVDTDALHLKAFNRMFGLRGHVPCALHAGASGLHDGVDP